MQTRSCVFEHSLPCCLRPGTRTRTAQHSTLTPGRHMRRCNESCGAVSATGPPADCSVLRRMMRLLLSAARLKFLVLSASQSAFCSSNADASSVGHEQGLQSSERAPSTRSHHRRRHPVIMHGGQSGVRDGVATGCRTEERQRAQLMQFGQLSTLDVPPQLDDASSANPADALRRAL